MEIKDLVGLSQPLTKLIEVVSQGIGKLYRPHLIKKEADAKAYEIQTIARAVRENLFQSGRIEYKDQGVIIDSTDEKEFANQIEERVLSRLVYQEIKRQVNIEEITQYAADQLKNEETVSKEKLDEDWISRFFGIAQDISSEEMKMLWGKVLAGEVQKPKSYSLRTLELLKNLTKEDAEVFTRVGQIAITAGREKIFIPNLENHQYLEDEYGITFLDCLKLRELGLLVPDLQYYLNPEEHDLDSPFTNGTKLVLVRRKAGTPRQDMSVMVFTTIGTELLSLLLVESNIRYLEKFASHWLREGVQVFIGDITKFEGETIRYTNLTEITNDTRKNNTPFELDA